MKDLVSNRWILVAPLAASMSIVSAISALQGFPWTGLMWMSLALATALWTRAVSTRAIAPGCISTPAVKTVL